VVEVEVVLVVDVLVLVVLVVVVLVEVLVVLVVVVLVEVVVVLVLVVLVVVVEVEVLVEVLVEVDVLVVLVDVEVVDVEVVDVVVPPSSKNGTSWSIVRLPILSESYTGLLVAAGVVSGLLSKDGSNALRFLFASSAILAFIKYSNIRGGVNPV